MEEYNGLTLRVLIVEDRSYKSIACGKAAGCLLCHISVLIRSKKTDQERQQSEGGCMNIVSILLMSISMRGITWIRSSCMPVKEEIQGNWRRAEQSAWHKCFREINRMKVMGEPCWYDKTKENWTDYIKKAKKRSPPNVMTFRELEGEEIQSQLDSIHVHDIQQTQWGQCRPKMNSKRGPIPHPCPRRCPHFHPHHPDESWEKVPALDHSRGKRHTWRTMCTCSCLRTAQWSPTSPWTCAGEKSAWWRSNYDRGGKKRCNTVKLQAKAAIDFSRALLQSLWLQVTRLLQSVPKK